MNKMSCSTCETELTLEEAVFGESKTAFCKKCYEKNGGNGLHIVNENVTGNIKKHSNNVENDVETPIQKVLITDIHMPFGSMIVFMVKWALASIPAMFILFLAFRFVLGYLG